MLVAPTPYREAAAFISGKPVVSREVFAKLLPALKGRAFVIAGIEAASVLQNVRDTIAMLPQGGDWEEIKAAVLEQIDPYFVDPDADDETRAAQTRAANRRAELLLRTHGQQAYMAGLYGVADAQRDIFPYWQYASLGDGRVRPSHAALDGIVLPANHEFWQSHTPPWDWGCRCEFIPVSEETVQEMRDEDEALPIEKKRVIEGELLAKLENERTIWRPRNLATGEGDPVPYNVQSPREAGKEGAFEWNPADLTLVPEQLKDRYDAQTWAQFESWAKQAEIEPEQTVWAWMNGGKEEPAPAPAPTPQPEPAPEPAPAPAKPKGPKIVINPPAAKPAEPAIKGFSSMAPALKAASAKHRAAIDAAKAARADAEKALAEAVRNMDREARLLRYFKPLSAPRIPEDLALDAATKAIETARQAARAEMHAILALPAGERATVGIKTFAKGDNHEQGMEFIQSITSSSVFSGPDVDVRRTSKRTNADKDGMFIDGKQMRPQTVVHELAHCVEGRRRDILAKSAAFRASRTVGEKPKWLGKPYKRHELALEDEWEKRGGTMYSGKEYKDRNNADFATEILSVGTERLYADPAGFIADDPEYAEFVINTLRGL